MFYRYLYFLKTKHNKPRGKNTLHVLNQRSHVIIFSRLFQLKNKNKKLNSKIKEYLNNKKMFFDTFFYSAKAYMYICSLFGSFLAILLHYIIRLIKTELLMLNNSISKHRNWYFITIFPPSWIKPHFLFTLFPYKFRVGNTVL